MARRHGRIDSDGRTQEACRNVIVPGLERDDADVVQRPRVSRHQPEHLFIRGNGVIEPILPVKGKPFLKQVLNVSRIRHHSRLERNVDDI